MPSYSLDPMITRLYMPFPNVNVSCPLLFWLVMTVLFHWRASSPAQYPLARPFVSPPTHVVTSPGLNDVSRDKISLIITQCLGLPLLYSPPTHAVTSPGLNNVSRDKTSLIITQRLGLPPLYSHPTITLVCTLCLESILPHPDICSLFSLFRTH
jgi:hypothetical protein